MKNEKDILKRYANKIKIVASIIRSINKQYYKLIIIRNYHLKH